MDDATTTLPEAVTASVEALWTFGPPSAYAGVDPDSERVVAYALAPAVQRLVALVGADAAKRDEAKALLRAEIARRSEHRYDRGQADRLCRAVQRGWMVAVIRRHPRAERFQSLVDALNRGRYSEKQRDLALKLIAEVA